jgi:uncharacterized protein (TIGR00645 family)
MSLEGMHQMKRIERFLELLIFNSRWLLAPFYIGLVAAIAMLLVKFLQEFLHIVPHLFTSTESEIVLAILTLVDMSLVANLLLIIIFSGYENFVSRIDTAGHEDRPAWMGKVDFSGLKVKLIGSIVAISAIELLKAFVNVAALTTEQLMWKVIIHVVLVSSGLLFAIMDHIAERTGQGKEGRGQSEQAGHKGL